MSLGRKSYFITVVEAGNITKAAQLLRVSQPSLSQYLTRLEKELGIKLLYRNTTPIRLTEAGELYLDYVKKLCAIEDKFNLEMDELKQRQDGTLALGIPSQLIPYAFTRVVEGFVFSNPQVNLAIREGTSLSTHNMLCEGKVDISFFHTLEKSDSLFNRYVIQKEELLIVCNRNHPLVAGRESSCENPIVLTEDDYPLLEGMRFLRLSDRYYLFHVMNRFLEQAGIHPKATLEVPNVQAILSFIQNPQSQAASVLSNFAIDGKLSDVKNLAFLKIKNKQMHWYLTMNTRSDTPLSSAGKLFWKYVRENPNSAKY